MPANRPKVLLTLPSGEAAAQVLERAGLDAIVASATDFDTLRREAADAAGLIVRAQLPPDLFDHTPRMLAVARQGTGVDLIPVDGATQHGIVVANAPGVNAGTVAEYVLAQMLAFARRLDTLDRRVRAGEWQPVRAFAQDRRGLDGQTLGVVGVGDIGGRVAALGRAFGMRVLGTQRSRPLPDGIEGADIDRLFAESDYIALTCPLTPETRGLVNARRLALAKPGVVLVNAARGPVIVEADLVAALEAGRIGGAALDVFDVQPLAADHPYRRFEAVRFSPHVAGITVQAFEETGRIAAEAVAAVLAGGWPEFFVNPACRAAHLARRASLGIAA
ncbi:MAG: NAD(P)-dependent oxidoreductase [Alphaproteobacteria bacterium]